MITCTFENGGKASLRHVVADNIIVKDGKILLIKRAPKLIEGGKWGLIGGYMERDETILQTVERETLEEAGWKVKDITLMWINDNPNRPGEDRQNVVFAHFSTPLEKVGEPDLESTEQKWFDLNNLPPDEEIAFDYTENIRIYKKYLKRPFPLPLVGVTS